MPPRWIHTLVDLIAFGLEPSWIHESKDRPWRDLGSKHREREHPFYVKLEKKLRKGISFIEIFDNEIPVIIDKAKKFESLIQKRYNTSKKEATLYANYYASYYYFHDLVDLLWDDLSYEEQKVYEAGIREIWLNPREFSNIFYQKTFKTYFTSDKYKTQRKFVRRQNYDHVNKEKLNDFLIHLKNIRFPAVPFQSQSKVWDWV